MMVDMVVKAVVATDPSDRRILDGFGIVRRA
jgi:hypothetical protein